MARSKDSKQPARQDGPLKRTVQPALAGRVAERPDKGGEAA
jgi:hypothetical protein